VLQPELTLAGEPAKGQNDSEQVMVTPTHAELDLNPKVPLVG
jgi:hypothetical protein